MMRLFTLFPGLIFFMLVGVILFQPTVSNALETPQSVTIATGRFQVDNSLLLIVCNSIPSVSANSPASSLVLDKLYTLSPSISTIVIGQEYKAVNNGKTYKLYFTKLPLVHIRTNGNAGISENDDRTPGSVVVTDTLGAPFNASMGIRIRGNLSRGYPKKSYNMQLWKDPAGNSELEASLLSLRNDSKWLLQALYNEPLRLNSSVSWSLWERVHKLYYAQPGFPGGEPNAMSAIRARYCDVFLNDAYIGVYGFSEDMDRKQLKLKKTGDNGEVNGELFKASGWSDATTFTGTNIPAYNPTSLTWAEYEIDYPKDPYWANLYAFVNFIVKSDYNQSKAELPTRLNLDNMIDYFLFLNLTGAKDNIGNNQFVARFKPGEPYLFIPWDLDGTFGYWNGYYIDEIAPNMGVLMNGLFNKLLSVSPNDYKARVRQRWFNLRQNDYSSASLKKNLADQYALLNQNGGYKREALKWSSSLKMNDLDYMNNWIDKRLALLDKYFRDFPATVCTPPAVPSITATPASLTSGQSSLLVATGCSYTVIWNTGQAGAQLSVSPSQTASYSAKCQQASGCESAFSSTVTVQVTPLPSTNHPPQAPVISPLLAEVNSSFSVILTQFTDPENQSMTYSLTGLPDGLNFSASNRTITGIPTSPGSYTLSYSAKDNQNATTSVAILLTVNPATSVPPVSVTGDFEGYLDKVECGSIRGWVWDRNKPNTALAVEFFADNNSIGTANADIFRQDLKNANKGNGAHVYNFTTPEFLKDGKPHTISAKVKDSAYSLKDSPKTLNCAGNGTGVPPVSNNQAPQAPIVSPLSATLNSSFSTTLPQFTDTDPLSYTLMGLPAGLNFTQASRLIAGTPLASGTFSLTYSATDGQLTTPVLISMVVSSSATSPVVTGNFEGYLDKVECGTIRGWVWDRNKPNTPMMVEFFANGTSIGTANADIFRQDIKDAGKGNGCHVYSFPTPASVKTGTSFQISAKVQYSTYTLSWSPKPLNCPAGSRLNGDAESDSGNELTVWPSPSDGNFEIGYRLDGGKPGELSIVDAAGRGWYQKSVEGEGAQSQRVSLTGANGIFLIQLRQGDNVQTRKISIGK